MTLLRRRAGKASGQAKAARFFGGLLAAVSGFVVWGAPDHLPNPLSSESNVWATPALAQGQGFQFTPAIESVHETTQWVMVDSPMSKDSHFQLTI
jgi:hypothetical protein